MGAMRAQWISVLGAMMLACPSSEEGGAGDGPSDERPSPYAESSTGADAEPPTLSAEQAAASAMAGLRTFVVLEPDAAIAAVEAMLVLEADCPEEQAEFTEGDATVITFASAGCTTSAGLTFRGSGRLDRFTYAEGDATGEGASLSSEGGTLRLEASDGRFVELAGGVYYERVTSPEGAESYFEASGQLAADADTAAASPMLDAGLHAQGGLFSGAGGGYVVLGGQGSLGAAALPDGLAFQFSDLLVAPSECAKEPLGAVSVRDDAGYWHDIVFDAGTFDLGVDEDPVFDATKCDGCGAYLVGGERMGEACVAQADVDALVAWEGTPW